MQTKRRNNLQQKKMNDLDFVAYNSKDNVLMLTWTNNNNSKYIRRHKKLIEKLPNLKYMFYQIFFIGPCIDQSQS